MTVEVGDPQVWEELSLAVSGLSAGQETTFERRHEHPAAGEGGAPEVHEQKFRVKVDEVKERDLPPLDDAFAAKVNPEFATFEALREAVVVRLRQQKDEQRREARHQALLNQLRDRHPIDLPQGVVRREVEGMVQEYAENLARRGVDVEKAHIDWGRVGEEMAPMAEKRVHARLLLDAIADPGSSPSRKRNSSAPWRCSLAHRGFPPPAAPQAGRGRLSDLAPLAAPAREDDSHAARRGGRGPPPPPG